MTYLVVDLSRGILGSFQTRLPTIAFKPDLLLLGQLTATTTKTKIEWVIGMRVSRLLGLTLSMLGLQRECATSFGTNLA